jgi:hypothetical protein
MVCGMQQATFPCNIQHATCYVQHATQPVVAFGDPGVLERVTTWWQEVNHEGKAMVEFHDGDTGLVDLLHERYCLSGARCAGSRSHCVWDNMGLCLVAACAAHVHGGGIMMAPHGSSAVVPELKPPTMSTLISTPVSCRRALL